MKKNRLLIIISILAIFPLLAHTVQGSLYQSGYETIQANNFLTATVQADGNAYLHIDVRVTNANELYASNLNPISIYVVNSEGYERFSINNYISYVSSEDILFKSEDTSGTDGFAIVDKNYGDFYLIIINNKPQSVIVDWSIETMLISSSFSVFYFPDLTIYLIIGIIIGFGSFAGIWYLKLRK